MEKFCIGVDIGGTSAKIGAVTEKGELPARLDIPSDRQPGRMFDKIAEAVAVLTADFGLKNCAGIGVGVPGPVQKQAVVTGCVNLAWGDVDVAKSLESRTGLPVKVENDANLALLGEMWFGAARGYRDVAMLTIGTGIGAGIAADGRLLSGADGAAGEVGHIPLFFGPGDFAGSGTGAPLELEHRGSATGIVQMAKHALQQDHAGSLLAAAEHMTAKDVVDAARAGDALSLRIVEEAGRVIGMAAAVIGCVVNPKLFVLGGGVSASGDLLLKSVLASYRQYVFPPAAHAEFKLAELQNNAGMLGAAALIFHDGL